MSALSFYLDAPLQSWGASSKFQFRETNSFPTKSAIIGLLAAALGIDKHASDETERLAPLAALRFTVVKLPKSAPATRLTDFHTVGGGYDKDASARERMSIPRKASGAPFGTVITRRSYLMDVAFAAIVEGPKEVLEQVSSALSDPVWGVWLGRKTCLPATPLTPTLAGDRASAFAALLQILPGHQSAPLESCEYQEEWTVEQAEGGISYQSDQPRAFGSHHGPIPAPYRSRGIRHHRPE